MLLKFGRLLKSGRKQNSELDRTRKGIFNFLCSKKYILTTRATKNTKKGKENCSIYSVDFKFLRDLRGLKSFSSKIELMTENRNKAATFCAVAALFLVLALAPVRAAAGPENEPEEEQDEIGSDSDPTKPVAFSFREEFYDLQGDSWRNVMILRGDQLILEKQDLLGHRRGLILRADLPMVSSHRGGSTRTGLGDIYGQALLIPRVKDNLLCAFGTGLVFPTATGDEFGHGKWIASPAAVPIWYFPHQGFAYIKVQDWISFEGDSGRPDVHYLTTTPTFLWRLSKQWWMVLDGETYTDWEMNNQTSYKGGFLLGWMFSRTIGLSLKAEIPFGEHRQGDWTLKMFFFITRY